jgi:hypothetical protein
MGKMSADRVAIALERAAREAERSRKRHGHKADSLCDALSLARSRLACGDRLDEVWIRDSIRDAASWSGDEDVRLLANLGALARAIRDSTRS